MTERIFRLARIALIVLGLGLIGLNTFLGDAVNFTLPLVFLMLGAGFLLLVFAVSRTSVWGALFYIPATLLTALGLVFMINVITNDWNAWAYAWMLLLAGAGVGQALMARQLGWRRLYFMAGVWTAAAGVTFFALFGAIAGGLFIRVMAPIMLVMGGLARNRHISINTSANRLCSGAMPMSMNGFRSNSRISRYCTPRVRSALAGRSPLGAMRLGRMGA